MHIEFDTNSCAEKVLVMFFCRFYIKSNDNIIVTEKHVVCGLTRIGAVMLPLKMSCDNDQF